MATYKVYKNGVLTTLASAAEAQLEQWHGRAVMDTTTTAGTGVTLNESGTTQLKLSDAHSLLGPTHAGKTWSGA